MLPMDCPRGCECKYGPVYKEAVVDTRKYAPYATTCPQKPVAPTYEMKATCCKIYKAQRLMDQNKT